MPVSYIHHIARKALLYERFQVFTTEFIYFTFSDRVGDDGQYT